MTAKPRDTGTAYEPAGRREQQVPREGPRRREHGPPNSHQTGTSQATQLHLQASEGTQFPI